MDSTLLKDLIIAKAFTRVVYSNIDHRVKPDFRLERNDVEALCREAANYGYAKEQASQLIDRVMSDASTPPPTVEGSVAIPHLGNGDELVLTDSDGARLRLLHLEGFKLLVLSDDAAVVRPGDIMHSLLFAVNVDRPFYARVQRGRDYMPSSDRAYAMQPVAGIEIIATNPHEYRGYLQSTSSARAACVSETLVYSNSFDAFFKGFPDSVLESDNRGQLFEINLKTMTYGLNPKFDYDAAETDESIYRSIEQAFDYDEEIDNIYRIAAGEPGSLSLIKRNGTLVIGINRKASISIL